MNINVDNIIVAKKNSSSTLDKDNDKQFNFLNLKNRNKNNNFKFGQDNFNEMRSSYKEESN